MTGPALAPGATIGIIGGGQLGRMTALAAARLGYRCHVFCQSSDEPAAQVAAAATIARFDDKAALDRFARAVDVVTVEFENVPAAALRRLARRVPTRPDALALSVAQDRAVEKSFINDAGVATASWAAVPRRGDLAAALAKTGAPAILKTNRLGYDGKWQARVDRVGDAGAAWEAIRPDRHGAILERRVAFASEASVIVARGTDGRTASWVPVENHHLDHVLSRTIVPAPLPAAVRRRATRIGERLATALDLVGLLAVELFVMPSGRLLVNELAPRPHNSGHWTIDAAATSQFEQLVRAVCGLPLGSTDRHADAVMDNLLGDDVRAWLDLLAEPGARLHLYGKDKIRPVRKMGHVTRLLPLTDNRA
ncbi:MAG: 5-(carboxyamino)imidazole ribonucleotide synthase [Alphaproteobacteria bacterium]|nr:5-(carboxyamino)imidazole ribonucleotide synthase [Alphaproteobacteria bacterium]